MCAQYWPKDLNTELNTNGLSALLQQEQNYGDYVHRQIKLTHATVRFKCNVINAATDA